MAIRKTTIRTQAGVKLITVDEVGRNDLVTSRTYRLSTLRQAQPRIMADRNAADEAFDLEVISSLADPTVQRLVSAGWT